jgi:methylated-DNA-protein-cysteine methyltransferase-like protein
MWLNHAGRNYSTNAYKMATRKTAPKTATKKAGPVKEKLISVKPGGGKDVTFYELVFDVARQIPKGRVTSYGAIAAALGAKSSSRLVGWAMHEAGRVRPKVPAHRVVNRIGMLSGKHHFETPTRMKELLEKEGVKVKKDQVVDFKKRFWDPSTELI